MCAKICTKHTLGSDFMIYSKVDNPKCATCVFADLKGNGANALCEIKGSVPADFCCKKYKYDIFKKKIIPKKNLDLEKYSEKDFSL